jgi:hypothetical protein
MTDNCDLFSDIRRINRVPIQVVGGILYSNYSGTFGVHGLDGSTGLLSNVLWVLNLGVNLVSARSVCKYGGFTRSFNNNDMYIMTEKQVKIHTTLDSGPYVVNFIADKYRQKTFTATLQPIYKLRKKDQKDAITVNTNSLKMNKEITTSEGSNT